MNNSNLLNNLLFLYDNITITLSTKNRQINTFYIGKDIYKKEISYEEFAKAFVKKKNLDKSSYKKLTIFLDNLSVSEEPFSIVAKYNSIEDEIIELSFKGYKTSDDEVLIIIEDVEHSNIETFDPLTKVFSRENTINKIKDAMTKNEPFALMIIDIDNFKLFNDNYGHMFGDIVLVETAASIKKYIGNRGFVGRIGGDEFLLLIYLDNNYDLIHDACSAVRKAITNVSNHNIKQAVITATVGCAAYPSDATDYNILFKKADKALYRGKRKGRNCFIIYDETKCGAIEENEDIKVETTTQLFQMSTNSNIVAGVLEILNRTGSISKNIDDALSLVGNYFLLDRIAFFTENPETLMFTGLREWINPRANNISNRILLSEENIVKWQNMLDKTGMVRLVQVASCKEKHPEVYKMLVDQGASAILGFELKYVDRNLGFIRFDMCSINRFWQPNDIASLMLISKLFTMFLNTQYENLLHRKTLYFDRLTEVYNFSKWMDDVYDYLEEKKIINYTIVNISINNFHYVNDRFGTKYGDSMLIAIGNALKLKYKNNAIFCREVSDKFLLFLPITDKNEIEESLLSFQKLVVEISKIEILDLLFGIYINEIKDTLNLSIDKANITRKQNKNSQKITYFSNELFAQKTRENELEVHIKDALDENEFELYLQPKINTITGKAIGAEALTRWNFKHQKLLMPGEFIPLFEKNGYINYLDYRVFENVCIFLRECIDNGIEPVIISVNVSRYQRDFDEYITTINKIRKKYNIDASLLEIEITEGMYIDNIDKISSFIKNLHDCGYKVSMDDFGSGYSNLASLAALDVDLIKLDKGFCTNIDNTKEKTILKFIMTLANNLNMEVLCEGVESEDLVKYLKSIGCYLVQGFLYERPIPKDEFKNKYLNK